MISGRIVGLFIAQAVVIILLFVIDLMTGDSALPVGEVWAVLSGEPCSELTRQIVFSVRLLRAVVAVLVGVSLSVSGLQMQTVFQNPLADPYLLGVSSGAGLGVALFILGVPLIGSLGIPWVQSLGIAGAGWAGSAIVLLGVVLISRRIGSVMGVLIIGVMIGYVAGAVIQILQYLSSAEQLKLFTLWSMGSLGQVTLVKLWVMFPIVLTGMTLAVRNIKALNLFLLGENYDYGHSGKAGTYMHSCFNDVAHRHGDSVLRSGGIYRVGYASCGPDTFCQCRSSGASSGMCRYGSSVNVGVRYRIESIGPSGELHSCFARCACNHLGDI